MQRPDLALSLKKYGYPNFLYGHYIGVAAIEKLRIASIQRSERECAVRKRAHDLSEGTRAMGAMW
jgi:hypothetical protein